MTKYTNEFLQIYRGRLQETHSNMFNRRMQKGS